MPKLQLIFIVETSDNDKSDTIYVRTVIDKFYIISDKEPESIINIQIHCLNGKHHYKDKKVINYIRNQTKMFSNYNEEAITKVIYFIDTDSIEKEYKNGSFFYNLQEFCKTNDYDLVWFCKNAENVFLNKEPDKIGNKTVAAKKFVSDNIIENIDENKISKDVIDYGCEFLN